MGALAGCAGACGQRAFALALVFESRYTGLSLHKFEWPGMVNKNGMFGGGAMWISPSSPKEMSFMVEELEGIPKWIDLGWRSPIIEVKTGAGPNDFINDFSRTRTHEKRVHPKAAVPQSVVDEVQGARGKVLKLHFIFDDAKAWVEYEVQQWR